MGMKPRPDTSEFKIEYRPLKGVTRTLLNEAQMISDIEKEGYLFQCIIPLSEAKLMGFVFRKVEQCSGG